MQQKQVIVVYRENYFATLLGMRRGGKDAIIIFVILKISTTTKPLLLSTRFGRAGSTKAGRLQLGASQVDVSHRRGWLRALVPVTGTDMLLNR